jgi:exodeoxyribonuclease X
VRITSVDFETSGIPEGEVNTHAIVEIGTCSLFARPGGFAIADPDHKSVLCDPGRPIDHAAMATHHITDEMVRGATGNVSFIREADYYCAHNADFEKQFWKPEKPLICTWKVALRLWPEESSHKLQFLRYRLGLPADPELASPPHRAGPDAYVCALLMERMIQENRCTIEDMVRWSSGPGLLTIVNFGKHKGERWEKLPDGYLNWILDSDTTDKNLKANALFRLKQRNVINGG